MSVQTAPDAVASYVDKVRKLGLNPVFLTMPGFMPAQPTSNIVPFAWRWSDVRDLMLEAGKLLPVGASGADRRVPNLINPGVTAGLGTSHTLTASIQMVLPGEVAPAHRHLAAALRFIIEGNGAQTTVNGNTCTMSAGDLVLTPSWNWHDHSNPGNDTMIWLDGLDVPLMNLLQSTFYEEFPHKVQPPKAGAPASEAGVRTLLPTWVDDPAAPTFFRYTWAATQATLAHFAGDDGDRFNGTSFAYTNPYTGGPVLSTIGCEITLLRPGARTQAHRHTSSVVYHVVEGSGCTVIDGRRLEWTAHDTIVLPTWAWHEHHNANPRERAVLFSFNDEPTFRALGLYREEALAAGHQ